MSRCRKRMWISGGGLERLAAATEHTPDVFRIDAFQPCISTLEKKSGVSYADNAVPFRVIADHLRAALFIIADGVTPSNTDRGVCVAAAHPHGGVQPAVRARCGGHACVTDTRLHRSVPRTLSRGRGGAYSGGHHRRGGSVHADAAEGCAGIRRDRRRREASPARIFSYCRVPTGFRGR